MMFHRQPGRYFQELTGKDSAAVLDPQYKKSQTNPLVEEAGRKITNRFLGSLK